MSIIVAVRKDGQTAMASDSLLTFGDKQVPLDNIRGRKMRRVGKALLGIAGWSVYEDIFDHYLAGHPDTRMGTRREVFSSFLALWHTLHDRYPFVRDQHEDAESPFGELDSTFLIANAEGLYLVTSDLGVTAFEQYYAIGSGAEYSLGALHPLYGTDLDAEALARRAVTTAIAFDVHCGGDVHTTLL